MVQFVYMNIGSKILLVTTIALLILSFSASAYNYFFLENYYVIHNIPCDPTLENCFTGTNEDGEIEYTKLLQFYAPYGGDCDGTSEECYLEICESVDAKCTIMNCDVESEFVDRFEGCSE